MAELAMTAALMATGPVGTAIAVGLQAVSALSDYQTSRAESDAIKQTANYNAEVSRQQAKQERGVAQLKAKEERRSAEFAASEVLAKGAKGGGGIDVSTLNIISELTGEGDLQARLRTFEGESRARSLETGADLELWEAKNKSKMVRRKGVTTALSKLGSAAMSAGSSFSSPSSTTTKSHGKIIWDK